MDHPRAKWTYLPTAINNITPEQAPPEDLEVPERPGIYLCPCCGCRTFPVPLAEAIAYICPVCMWENDVFTCSDEEPSDENHGLSLVQGRENYRRLDVCDPRLLSYARPPRPEELP